MAQTNFSSLQTVRVRKNKIRTEISANQRAAWGRQINCTRIIEKQGMSRWANTRRKVKGYSGSGSPWPGDFQRCKLHGSSGYYVLGSALGWFIWGYIKQKHPTTSSQKTLRPFIKVCVFVFTSPLFFSEHECSYLGKSTAFLSGLLSATHPFLGK